MPPKLEFNLLWVICGNEIYILIDEEMEGHDLHAGILCFLFTRCVWYIKMSLS